MPRQLCCDTPPTVRSDEIQLGLSEPNNNHQSPVCLKNSKQGPSGVAYHSRAGQWPEVGLFLVSFKDRNLLPNKIFVAFLLLLVKEKRPEGMAVVNFRAWKQNVVVPDTGQDSHCALYESEGRMRDKGCKPHLFLLWLMDISGPFISGII